jgi:glycosyltransferase involved in cell wall biosynthesis
VTPLTFVIAVNNKQLFESNFLASPCLSGSHSHQILVQEGFSSASIAYNDAIDRSTNDLIVFVHQDMIFPELWLLDLQRALDSLERTDPQWGVLGCYGETLDGNGRGYIYSGGLGVMGKPMDRPAPVQTLDEIVLILRKSSGLRFDEDLPHFHFYGADICMAAAARGWKSYAISAFCVHNTQQNFVLPKEFYESYRHVKRRWKNSLPIRTTCVTMTKFDIYMYRKRIQEAYLRFILRKEIGAFRVKDGRALLAELGDASRNCGETASVR